MSQTLAQGTGVGTGVPTDPYAEVKSGAQKDTKKDVAQEGGLDFINRHTENLAQLFDGLFSTTPSLNEAVHVETSQTMQQQFGRLNSEPGIKNDAYFRALLSGEAAPAQAPERTQSSASLRGMPNAQEKQRNQSGNRAAQPIRSAEMPKTTGSTRRSSQPESFAMRRAGSDAFARRSSGGTPVGMPRLPTTSESRKGSQLLANSTNGKDHEELAKLLIAAEQKVQLRREKYERIKEQYNNITKGVRSVRAEREAATLKAQTRESEDELEQAVFERTRKQRQLMHAMSLRQEPPEHSSQGLEVLDTMRKYYYAQRQNQVHFRPEPMLRRG